MKKVSIEGLTIDEVLLWREDNLILGRTIVGSFVLLEADRTNPLVLCNHPIEGIELEHLAFLHRDNAALVEFLELRLNLGIEFRTGFLQISLLEIVHIIDMGIGTDIVFILLFLCHIVVLAKRDGLVGFLILDHGDGKEHGKGLLTLQDVNKAGILTLCRVQVNGWFLSLILLQLTFVVQVVGYLVVCDKYRHVELSLGTEQKKQEGVDTVICPAAQVTGHHKVPFLYPRLLPVLVNRLDTLHHQLCEGVKSTVFRTLSILASPMVLFPVISHSYCCVTSSDFLSSNFHSEISFT